MSTTSTIFCSPARCRCLNSLWLSISQYSILTLVLPHISAKKTPVDVSTLTEADRHQGNCSRYCFLVIFERIIGKNNCCSRDGYSLLKLSCEIGNWGSSRGWAWFTVGRGVKATNGGAGENWSCTGGPKELEETWIFRWKCDNSWFLQKNVLIIYKFIIEMNRFVLELSNFIQSYTSDTYVLQYLMNWYWYCSRGMT